MDKFNLYKDISARTKGEIFIGVVGPVRTGKSAFIRRFMEELVIPGLVDNEKTIARDELPTSGNGKTITTVEPKFVPREGAAVELGKDIQVKIRLVDCVGYPVPGAEGVDEEQKVRMVKTPWSNEDIPFSQAAEIGTGKVIRDHATIGIVLTCDGSFGELPRESFLEAEKKSILAMEKTGKPFLVIVNSEKPYGEAAKNTVNYLKETFGVTAVPINCQQLKKEDIYGILEQILYEFPLIRIEFFLPKWVETLPGDHEIKAKLIELMKGYLDSLHTIRDARTPNLHTDSPFITRIRLDNLMLDQGVLQIGVDINDTYYYQMLSEMSGVPIHGEYQLIAMIRELSAKKKTFENVERALTSVKGCGYGVITPEREEIRLDEPEVTKQGNKYGVKMKATSPSIHLIKAEIETEIAPIVGSQQQAEELLQFIKDNSQKEGGIWNTQIFGKSIDRILEEGIQTKLSSLGEESQVKLQDTMKKIVNDSKGGMVCIII